MKTLYENKEDDIDIYFKLPPKVLRIYHYNGKIPDITTYKNLAEDDEKICYSETIYSIRFNPKADTLYRKIRTRKGFTYSKKTKKVLLWFDTTMMWVTSNIPSACLRLLGIEWLRGLQNDMITKGLLQKAISKNITNPTAAVRYYLKYAMRMKLPAKVFHTVLTEQGMNIYTIKKMLYTAINPVKTIHYLKDHWKNAGNNKTRIVVDLTNECMMLNTKFDISWSFNRLNDMHLKQTKELMLIEAEFIEDKQLEYNGDIKLPKGYKLLSSRKEVFMEGTGMKHCLYTSYWHNIEDYKYFAISIDKPGVRATLGIRYGAFWTQSENVVVNESICVDQLFGERNSSRPEIQLEREFAKTWIQDLNVQEFFKRNYHIRREIQVKNATTTHGQGINAAVVRANHGAMINF